MSRHRGIRRIQGLRLSVAAVLTVGVVGCSLLTADEWVRRTGALAPSHTHAQAVVVPGTARVGVPFTITVATVGSGSCVRPSGASVEVVGLTATVVPMDEVYVGGRHACTDDLVSYPRTVTLTFMEPGSASVQVSGVDAYARHQVATVVRAVRIDP